jgi:hypothetical protein
LPKKSANFAGIGADCATDSGQSGQDCGKIRCVWLIKPFVSNPQANWRQTTGKHRFCAKKPVLAEIAFPKRQRDSTGDGIGERAADRGRVQRRFSDIFSLFVRLNAE